MNSLIDRNMKLLLLVLSILQKTNANAFPYEECVTLPATPVCQPSDQYRSIDGTCNNLKNPLFGAINTPLKRTCPARYYDKKKLNTPANIPGSGILKSLPTAQEVSDAVFTITANEIEEDNLSAMHPYFGQFLDHDITLSEHTVSNKPPPTCTKADEFQCPNFPILKSRVLNNGCFEFVRSKPMCTSRDGVRQQANSITAFIDASMVYGSTKNVMNKIRKFKNGLLRMSDSNTPTQLLPNNKASSDACNHIASRGGCFLAGDVRVNEHIALSSLHTLFALEHNRIAKKLKSINKRWSDDKIFNEARKIVGAIMQNIVYYEYLPTLKLTLSKYTSYKKNVNPSIATEFSAAAFRFGHSQIKSKFSLVNQDYVKLRDVPLRRTFFNTTILRTDGIQPILLGLIDHTADKVDSTFAEALGKKLFLPEHNEKGFKNLLGLNIQRGRDHGLPGYVQMLEYYFKITVLKFSNLNKLFVPRKLKKLKDLYGSIKDIDLFVAGLLEKKENGKVLGKTFSAIIKEQFKRLRNGDRFYFENKGVFNPQQLLQIKKVKLSSLFCNNLDIKKIQRNVLSLPDYADNKRLMCKQIPRLNLIKWKE